jgi:DeoR family transcriptional regulator, suf operon transcriptional repressor
MNARSLPLTQRGSPSPGSTKGRLLALLKRHGGCTVDDLSAGLGLAPMTVRQHLTVLERDDLVEVREVRNGPGRPRHVFRLTIRGEDAFPKRYDRLAAALLREIAVLEPEDLTGRSPAEKQEFVLGRLARQEAERLAPRVRGVTLGERVASVASVLEAEGGLTEWQKTERGYEIREYNCVYRGVAGEQPVICAWHRDLLSRLLGVPVTRAEQPLSRTGQCCRLLVSDDGAAEPHSLTNMRLNP